MTRQALEQEENDRAAIAARLLASWDQEDPDELAAFASELERRALEMESGAVEGIAWEDLEARLAGIGRSESYPIRFHPEADREAMEQAERVIPEHIAACTWRGLRLGWPGAPVRNWRSFCGRG